MSALLVDPRASDNGETIRQLPHRYAVSQVGEYAHRPRTATRHSDSGNLHVTALCGQHLRNPILTDDPGSAECGTCLGRDLGITEHDVLYRPRTCWTLPKRWCEGSRWRDLAVDIPGRRDVICLMCGQIVGMHGDGPRRHEHGGTAVACPAHGRAQIGRDYYRHTQPAWAESDLDMLGLGPRDDVFDPGTYRDRWVALPRLVCRAWRCTLTPRRFWIISPHGRGAGS